jgi:hypothetical protein
MVATIAEVVIAERFHGEAVWRIVTWLDGQRPVVGAMAWAWTEDVATGNNLAAEQAGGFLEGREISSHRCLPQS